MTFPDSASLTYGYDNAHRLTSVTNNLGESVTYTLDAMGDRTKTQIKSASSSVTKTSTAAFDDLARMLQAIGASSQTTTFTYDKDNKVLTKTDPRNKLYQYAFDALDRLTQFTDPDSFQTTTTYNGKSEVTGVTDARSLATTYVRDGFGDVIEKTSPDTGSTTYWYDADGNLTKSVDARSVEVDYTYDNKDRPLSRTAAGENLSLTYDTLGSGTYGVNRLGSISDPSGSTTLSYDQLGHLTQDQRVVSGFTYTTGYTNDASGNPLTITYPSGRIVNITRDTVGRISGITTQQSSTSSPVTIISGVSYEPFGPITGASYGNGVSLTQAYDQDYQLTSISATAGTSTIQNLSYSSYDTAGNILAITDNLNSARSQAFTYDDLNRLETAGGLYGSQSYTYDGDGNRLSATLAGVSSTYTLASSSNQLNSIAAGSATRSLSYLASGQLSGDQRTATSDYTFDYDGIGRMSSSALNGTTLATYAYNGFGQRVTKTIGSTVTDFIYDKAGRLLAEANGSSGAALREYIWLGDRPVAMVDDTGASPVIYYIHSDHLGKPQKLTDSSASIDWDGVYDAFGNPASVTGSATMLLMSTGQYYDSETQLNQNGARDYDPTTGRYVESDPLGLLGGINTYTYADGNPVSEKDPSGQFANLVAGAGIAAGLDVAYQLSKNGCVNWGQVAAAAVAGAVIASGAEFLAGGGLAALAAEGGEGVGITGEVLGDSAVDEGAAAESGAVDASAAPAEATVGEGSAVDTASNEAMAADDSIDAGLGETSASGDVGVSGTGEALTETAKGDAAVSEEETGTVWDAITPTQDAYEGTVIPQSFTLATEGADVWVAPNATEHLAEYALGNLSRGLSTDLVNIGTQSQLTSLQAAVAAATQNGVTYGTLINEGGWELMFSPARQVGQLPALIHALPF